jgi:hypothetical protein
MRTILIMLLALPGMAFGTIIVPVDLPAGLNFFAPLDALNGTPQANQVISIRFDLNRSFRVIGRTRPTDYAVFIDYIGLISGSGEPLSGTFTVNGATGILGGYVASGFPTLQPNLLQANPFVFGPPYGFTSIQFDIQLPEGATISDAHFGFAKGPWIPDTGSSLILLAVSLIGLATCRRYVLP